MNALTITLRLDGPLHLPIAYNYFIQSALYGAWREAFPTLHDEGYTDGTRSFRMFAFGPLQGRYRVEGKEILYTGPVSLEVRSPAEELMEQLAAHLLEQGFLRLGQYELPGTDLRTADRLLFFPSARVRALGPVTVHDTLPDGKTVYYAPTEERFGELLAENLAAKLQASGTGAPAFLGVRTAGTPRKVVTTFKGIYVTGYTGTFLLEADPEAMGLLYYTGLGSRNSQGFGMFDIEEQPMDRRE